MSITLQTIAIDSKEGRRFLRRVMRDAHETEEQWAVTASPETEWRFKFFRTEKGRIGDPDRLIEVMTDELCKTPSDRSLGFRKPFGDAQPVPVCRPVKVWFRGSTAMAFAKLLLDGARFEITASAGSSHSSQHGLAFYSLAANLPDIRYDSLSLGGQTVTKDGYVVISGAVHVSVPPTE